MAFPGGATSTIQAVVAAGTCFQLIAFKGAGFGTSDVLCGVPGISTLGAQAGSRAGRGAGTVGEAAAAVQDRLAGFVLPAALAPPE